MINILNLILNPINYVWFAFIAGLVMLGVEIERAGTEETKKYTYDAVLITLIYLIWISAIILYNLK